MSEHDKENEFYEETEEESQGEADIAGMLKKIQQQLVYLEKKVDTLISQSPARPPRERHFSKPFRPARPRSEHGSEQGQYSQDRRPDPGRPHDSRRPDGNRSDANRGFQPKKKPFYGRRER